jgi:hypothetical protein
LAFTDSVRRQCTDARPGPGGGGGGGGGEQAKRHYLLRKGLPVTALLSFGEVRPPPATLPPPLYRRPPRPATARHRAHPESGRA